MTNSRPSSKLNSVDVAGPAIIIIPSDQILASVFKAGPDRDRSTGKLPQRAAAMNIPCNDVRPKIFDLLYFQRFDELRIGRTRSCFVPE
jgi:hypothetical protein